ncbi:hypothetical protein [Halocatena pleomorpha]|uniref:Uncharacterized protein n=1 Tax=Halocatena pleomorpha TaxID=1785090 RepID=A0A3P3R2H6_9EURY|nr:hypothetical protein [Halocatena pleomorpha]RRJ27575.1 hypothetical protein EIK79_17625 [Halocatena pleomorpha]
MVDPPQRDLIGQFVGSDCDPGRATCSFHDETCTLKAGDTLQLEVEYVDTDWLPLFHRCTAHAVPSFPEEHSVYGVYQALMETTLSPTGAHLPRTNEYVPEALTITDITVVDLSPATEGRKPTDQC